MAQKIMVVDDDPAILKLACTTLRMRGFEVVTACNGLEAVQKVNAERPDLIVMDVNMPEMDGITALGHIKQSPASRDIPILIISSLPAGTVTKDVFEGGAFAFIEKPFELATLAGEVRSTLARRNLPVAK